CPTDAAGCRFRSAQRARWSRWIGSPQFAAPLRRTQAERGSAQRGCGPRLHSRGNRPTGGWPKARRSERHSRAATCAACGWRRRSGGLWSASTALLSPASARSSFCMVLAAARCATRYARISRARPTSFPSRAAVPTKGGTALRSFSSRHRNPEIAEHGLGDPRTGSERPFHAWSDQVVAGKIQPAAVAPCLLLNCLKAPDRAKPADVEAWVRVFPARQLGEKWGVCKRRDDALPVHEELLLHHL